MDFVFKKLSRLKDRLKAFEAKCTALQAQKAHLEAEIARLQSEKDRQKEEIERLRILLSGRMPGSESLGNQQKEDARKKLDEMIDKINRIIESLKTDVQ